MSFLTITLTNFGKDFERSLDQGFVDPSAFRGFSKAGELPRLFGGFLDLIFSRGDGRLLDNPSVDAIHALRQLTLVFGKINLECSNERIKAALSKFIQCESEVRGVDRRLSPSDKLDYRRVARLLWDDFLSDLERKLYGGELVPRHGPGATAERIHGNMKYNQYEWTERLEAVFPWIENAAASWSQYTELHRVDFREPGRERPVRVIHVPKTLKTPRIIAIEPVAMQYVQQGILEMICDGFEEFEIPRAFVNFSSQLPNQRLAKSGSQFGNLATLDLSEASDRVSNQLVRELLGDHTFLLECVDACRSRKADVPGHGVIRLAKFASMGSALCFPFEAMVFCTMVFLGIEKSLNRHLTRKDIKSFMGSVRVYGDDIIVPVDHVQAVVDSLEHFGAKVNVNKSFWNGKFRESCGKDYYAGTDVSIVRVREMFPSTKQHVRELVSTVSLRNQLALTGLYESTVQWLDKEISHLIKFPRVLPGSPILGRHDLSGSYDSERWDSNLHRPLVKGYVIKSRSKQSELDGYGALLKVFLKRGIKPFQDPTHLQRAGRSETVNIKFRWASPR
jgi:hypothetical protein